MARTSNPSDPSSSSRTRVFAAMLTVAVALHGAAESAAVDLSDERLAADASRILRRHCLECHGAAKQEGGLRLDGGGAAIASGDSGPAVIAGHPTQSELLRRVHLSRDESDAMPPLGPGLNAEELASLAAWIAAGAAWPEDADRPHWAYVPPVLQQPPSLGEGTPSLIDGWIAAGHAEHGLQFAPQAAPPALVRRLSFDLTGLPPDPDVVSAFTAEPTAQAYERLVDTFLESEEFGVRWARMWLDLARYADSHGFQRDDLRNLWAYRDWVVAAFNADMPFDQFTIEQLAGDLVPDAPESALVATGFHRCAPTNVEAGTDPEESRVNTTATVWLGSTLECAQCHDHKYDPFTQADYYRLAAYFNSTESEVARSDPAVPSSIKFVGPSLALAHDPWATERNELNERLRVAKAALKSAKEAKQAVDGADQSGAAADQNQSDDASEESIASMEASIKALTKQRDELPEAATLVMREGEEPRATFVLTRGALDSPADPVHPATPAVLPALPDLPANRLGLAEWLVHRSNPMTARVFVNRVWHELFGRGIVTTPEDFGVKGSPPSHPELLDALAVRFMDESWSLKSLIRAIVLSRTYQQDSRASAALRSVDPDNRWLARGPRFRLDAEAIRDNALAIAGLLSREKGGPSIRPPQPKGLWSKVGGEQYAYEVSGGEARYRRGLYVVLKRGSPYPGFVAFDATSRMTCVAQRSRSNTPLQALVLLNDEVFTEAALAFAERMLHELPSGTPSERIDHAFRIAVARQPTQQERDVLCTLLDHERNALITDPQRVRQLLSPLPAAASAEGPDAIEWGAWYAVATALLNLDETITKP